MLLDPADPPTSMIWIVSFSNNDPLAGRVIVKAPPDEFAKMRSFTDALKALDTSLIVVPAVPVVVIYLPIDIP